MASATKKQDKVRELQRTLYRAAKADPGRRFHALYDNVHRRDVLERAWGLVRAKRGAAGIDRQTIADVEQYGVSRLLDELAADLRDGSYRALPARRVFIPKPGRPDEQGPLSIPAVRDRVVQAATKLAIEPVFEADFLPCSFGFRPKRAAHDALQVLIDEFWSGRRWVVETDIGLVEDNGSVVAFASATGLAPAIPVPDLIGPTLASRCASSTSPTGCATRRASGSRRSTASSPSSSLTA